MTRHAATWIASALAACALAGAVLALWQSNAALENARRDLLGSEAAVLARLLREADGDPQATRLFGTRWRRGPAEDLLGEPVVARDAEGLVARAAVLDADGWDVVGRVELREPARGGERAPAIRDQRLPMALWLVLLGGAVVLVQVARRLADALAARGAAASLCRPVATWLVVGTVALSVPVIAAGRAAHVALAALTGERLGLATRVLAGRGDLAAVAGRPSGILDLTGLPFVPRQATHGDDVLLASGFAPPLARALAAAPPVRDAGLGHFRVLVDDVSWAVADAGPVRLVALPYDHAHDPSWTMAACVLLGLLAGVPLLALASVSADARRLRRELAAWSFLAPGLLHLAVFTVGPLGFAAWLSVHRWSLIDPARPFVGLANYADVMRDGAFWGAVANTALFTLHVPLAMAVSLGLALLVRPPGRLSTTARAAFFLPSITSLVAVAMVWQWLLHDQYGLINAALEAVGLPRVAWLTSPRVALGALMIVAAWTTLGFQTVLFQAGLTAIPPELYDAARIDGASRWRQFLHVTLPGLRPTLFFVLVTSVIGSFQVFGLVYVMTEGGPLHATDVAVFHIYEEAWELQRVGSAAAMSWVLFAVIFGVTWLHFRSLERRAA